MLPWLQYNIRYIALQWPFVRPCKVLCVLVESHYERVIIVIIWVQGETEDECNKNDNLRVQWDLTSFYPIVFDVFHVMQ